MAVPFASQEPLPGVVYSGTMSSADIYPTHAGIGGIRTQDRAVPAFAESYVQQAASAHATASLPAGLFSSPPGWAIIGLLGLLAVLWHTRG